MLTNDVVSFEQPGPDLQDFIVKICVCVLKRWGHCEKNDGTDLKTR